MKARSLAIAIVAAAFAGLWPAAASAVFPGEFDQDFGTNGVIFYPFGAGTSAASQVNAVAVQPDGKLVIAGYATDANSHHALMVARLRPDGRLDSSFGHGGMLVDQMGTSTSASTEAHALLLLPGGKILVGGQAQDDNETGFVLARLTSTGAYDSTFGSSGKVFMPTASDGPELPAVNALALQPDGKIVAAGTATFTDSGAHSTSQIFVARLSSGGLPDDSFDGDGKTVQQLAPQGIRMWSGLNAVAVQPDGKIVVGGFANNDGPGRTLVARLKSDGSLDDTGFGDGGHVYFGGTDGPVTGGDVDSVSVEPDGKILAVGSGYFDTVAGALAEQLNPSGSFDNGFGRDGVAITQLPGGPNAAIVPADGHLLLGGSSNSSTFMLSRLAALQGPPDTSFATGGSLVNPVGGAMTSAIDALAVQPDGKIVAAGSAGSQVMVARVWATGDSQGGGSGGGNTDNNNPNNPNNQPATVATVSNLSLSPSFFAAASRGGPIAAVRTGTTVAYSDDQAGKSTFTVLKSARGIRSGRRCVKPSRRHRRGKRCKRLATVGHFSHLDKAGDNSLQFTGRLHNRKLPPGAYRLSVQALWNGRLGPTVTKTFRIVRP